MGWHLDGQILPGTEGTADLESARAFGPSVVEEDDGTLRMWYTGHDGSTSRILEAVQHPGRPWERRGVSIDAGLTGESDGYGVESPSVVFTPGGYLMAYAGSNGADTRLHMASSPDGRLWEPLGTIIDAEEDDAVGATHPCLVVTGERWWLFYAGYDGFDNGRRAAILAAVSDSGSTWDRLGPVLEPVGGELALFEPWVVMSQRRFSMFYVSDDASRPAIQMATSEDGISWDRRGLTLPGSGDDVDPLEERSPCVLRLRDGTMRLWFATHPTGDVSAAYRLCSATFTGGADWLSDW
jgi:predicted GH43/DUF377 family glycosyl hydrolase